MNNKEILSDLLQSSRAYAKSKIRRRIDTALHGQHPKAAVVCCSDSRVIPEEIFARSIGDIFVIRTAGNTAGVSEVESLSYAHHHLGIELFIVLGHTHCGAVDSTIHGEHCSIFDAIASHIGEEKDPKKATMENARQVAKELSSRFPEVDVVPLLYDIETGEVSRL